MLRLPEVSEVLNDSQSMKAKALDLSGRFPQEWLPINFSIGANTTQDEIAKFSDTQMRLATDVYHAFKALGSHLEDSARPNENGHSLRFFRSMQAYNPGEWTNAYNDSSDFARNLLEGLILVTDDSTPRDRGKLVELEKQTAKDEAGGKLVSAVGASTSRYTAWCGEGRSSRLTGSFCLQAITETPCPEAECSAVSRGFIHDLVMTFYLPDASADVSAFTLQKMFQGWSSEYTEDVACPEGLYELKPNRSDNHQSDDDMGMGGGASGSPFHQGAAGGNDEGEKSSSSSSDSSESGGNDSPLKCNVCGRRMETKFDLEEHMSTAHPKGDGMDLEFPCYHCKDDFADRETMEAHIRDVHPEEWPHPEELSGIQLLQAMKNTEENSRQEAIRRIGLMVERERQAKAAHEERMAEVKREHLLREGQALQLELEWNEVWQGMIKQRLAEINAELEDD